MIYIYTDGACSNNQSDENFGAWDCILIYGDYEKELSDYEINTSNNRMEMKAVVEALKLLKRYDIPVKIFSDSAYIVNCINQKWYVNWEKNGWKNSKKEAVLNKDLWEEMLFYYKKIENIDFIKIKGHINPNNKEELNASYKKQEKDFNQKITLKEYKKHIEYNNKVDKLAVLSAQRGKDSIK